MLSVALVVLAALVYRLRRGERRVTTAMTITLALLALQVVLGGVTVLLNNVSWTVVMHYGAAAALLAAVLLVVVRLAFPEAESPPRDAYVRLVTWLAGDHVRAPAGGGDRRDHRLPRVVRQELPAVQGVGRAVDRPPRRHPHDPPPVGRRRAGPGAVDVAPDGPDASGRVAARGGGPRHGEPLPRPGGDRGRRRRGGRERRARGAALVARLAHVAVGRYAPVDGADAPGSRARAVERRRWIAASGARRSPTT